MFKLTYNADQEIIFLLQASFASFFVCVWVFSWLVGLGWGFWLGGWIFLLISLIVYFALVCF